MEYTVGIIKPDGIELDVQIMSLILSRGFHILCCKKVWLTRRAAEEFYKVHQQKPFYGELIDFMTSGPIFAMVLKGTDAIARWRSLMIEIREKFGTDVMRNVVHGTDKEENLIPELDCLFERIFCLPLAA